jgi:hypothetical protein
MMESVTRAAHNKIWAQVSSSDLHFLYIEPEISCIM